MNWKEELLWWIRRIAVCLRNEENGVVLWSKRMINQNQEKKKTRINQTCCVLMTTGEHRWQAGC